MSATLDDMEPYEIFQQELEAFLYEYQKQIRDSSETKNRLYIIDTFIEYFCFVNPKGGFIEITQEEIVNNFILYINNKYYSGVNKDEIKSSLLSYLNFISLKIHKLPNDLINGLNTI